MEILTGADIIEVERIKESIEDLGERFLNKIYTKNEINYCEQKRIQKYQSYAARFAGKEAIFKAISTLLEEKFLISFADVSIENSENGKPRVRFNPKALDILDKNAKGKIVSIDISLSHIKEYAIANVSILVEGDKDDNR